MLTLSKEAKELINQLKKKGKIYSPRRDLVEAVGELKEAGLIGIRHPGDLFGYLYLTEAGKSM